jgi:hypothetical protein
VASVFCLKWYIYLWTLKKKKRKRWLIGRGGSNGRYIYINWQFQFHSVPLTCTSFNDYRIRGLKSEPCLTARRVFRCDTFRQPYMYYPSAVSFNGKLLYSDIATRLTVIRLRERFNQYLYFRYSTSGG